jgi:hypothetical protein
MRGFWTDSFDVFTLVLLSTLMLRAALQFNSAQIQIIKFYDVRRVLFSMRLNPTAGPLSCSIQSEYTFNYVHPVA